MHDSSTINFNKILVIRLGAIGDVLLTTPLVRILKKRFPAAEIDYLVKETYTPLIKHNPNIKTVIPLKIHAKLSDLIQSGRQVYENRYDAVIDLQNNFKSRFITWFSMSPVRKRFRLGRWRRFLLVKLRLNFMRDAKPVPLRMLETLKDMDVRDDGQGLELFLSDKMNQTARIRLQKMEINDRKPFITIAPGASRETKKWLPSRFAEVGRHFIHKHYQILFIGGVEDREICSEIRNQLNSLPVNLAGECSLEETAAILQGTDLLITNDTGVMHIAAALKRPVAAIFGPTSEQLGFYPFRTRSAVIETALKCRPCSYHGTRRCPRKHFRCMKDITASQTIEASETLLHGELCDILEQHL